MEYSEKQACKIRGVANEVNSNEKVPTVKYIARCCENLGHKANERVCPARGKRCGKYNNSGHFEKVLKTKVKMSEGRKRGKDRRLRQLGAGVDMKMMIVNMLLVFWVE